MVVKCDLIFLAKEYLHGNISKNIPCEFRHHQLDIFNFLIKAPCAMSMFRMVAGAEAEAAGHCTVGLSVSAEWAEGTGAGEECAESAATAGPATEAPQRRESTEEKAGEWDAKRQTSCKGERISHGIFSLTITSCVSYDHSADR